MTSASIYGSSKQNHSFIFGILPKQYNLNFALNKNLVSPKTPFPKNFMKIILQ